MLSLITLAVLELSSVSLSQGTASTHGPLAGGLSGRVGALGSSQSFSFTL